MTCSCSGGGASTAVQVGVCDGDWGLPSEPWKSVALLHPTVCEDLLKSETMVCDTLRHGSDLGLALTGCHSFLLI